MWAPRVKAIDLNGEWVGTAGEKVHVKQSDNTFSVEIDDPKYSGIAGLKGTITGNTFIGQWYGTAQDCPNLAGYVPARGAISEGMIEVKIDSFKYNPETCVKTRDYEDSYSFNRVTTPKVTPQIVRKEPQRSKDESWMSPRFRDSKGVNDWIIDNFGDYEIKPVPVRQTRVRDRTPQIKPDQPSKDSVLHQMIQEQLEAGAIATNYQDGVLIENLFEGSWIFISPNALVTYSLGSGRYSYSIQQGEVEVREDVSNTDVETPNATIKSKDTHYWVSYDQDKEETTVGVYAGEVEIKTPDGKTTAVKPDGEKPGLVVVAQKFSIVKLAIFGAVLIIFLLGIVWLVKRRKKR